MTQPAIRLRARSIGYVGAAPALRDVDLRIDAGEAVALVGGNGTGKSALLKTVVGLLPALDASLQIFETSIVPGAPQSTTSAVGAGAGLVLQNPDDQIFGTTVLDDAIYGPLNQGHTKADAERYARAALVSMGVHAHADRPVERLSFGEKKRVAIAGVLAMRPRLLLLDEPTAGLDPRGEADLLRLLAGIVRREGTTLLVATHAVDLVPYFARRVIALGEGRVLADAPPHDFFKERNILDAAHVRAPWIAEFHLRLSPGSRFATATLPLTVEEALACHEPV